MGTQPAISEDSFLTFTMLDELRSTTTRKIVAANASRFGRRNRRKLVIIRSGSIVQSFLTWRSGAAQVDGRRNIRTASGQNKAANLQAIAELGCILESIPASLNSGISLQHCKLL
jgi:hypothetical protein